MMMRVSCKLLGNSQVAGNNYANQVGSTKAKVLPNSDNRYETY